MTDSPPDHWQDCAQLTDKVALELIFAEPGKDNGLLPVNSLVSELEERTATLPPAIRDAIAQARAWVDAIFNATGLFDAPTLKGFGEWTGWMQSAITAARLAQPISPMPAAWASTSAASVPVAVAATAKSSPAEEIALVLNIEGDGELLREFANESREHLQNIELGVLTLEDNPGDGATLNSIFRAFHTFKGGSGFLNLTPINRLAHELESLLDLARQHKLTITSSVTDVILAGGDTLKAFVTEMELQLGGQHPPAPILIPIQPLLARVRAVVEGGPLPVVVPTETAEAASEAKPVAESAEVRSTANSVVKVDTQKLDSLVDLVGEMVIAQSMVAQNGEAAGSQQLSRNMAQLGRITKELQRIAMSLRMVPVRGTFQKMARLVRDVSAKAGKQVELVTNGEETELDRTITEEISDPLVHMIRNSVDHGIEKPEARIAVGKPAQGTVTLSAFHQGGSIVIEIKDDGAGLNKERILAKAISQGLAQAGEPLSEKEIFQFIFAAGFSTAEKVTDLSGRGVGMDVVRRNIERLRGKIEIQSVPGHGSTFTIALPLTLAIIDGLIVSVDGRRYILPTLSVRESFRPTAEMLSSLHERGEMVNVRGRLLPLLRLGEHFGTAGTAADPMKSLVVVIESDNQQRCLLVDHLLGKQEVVIKSLGETFRRNPALAGAAILGDGRVGLILDVNALVKFRPPPQSLAA